MAVVADVPPGAEGRRSMADDGWAIVEAEAVAGGEDMSNEPAQADVLIMAAGTVGIIDVAEGARTAPVR